MCHILLFFGGSVKEGLVSITAKNGGRKLCRINKKWKGEWLEQKMDRRFIKRNRKKHSGELIEGQFS